MMIQPCDPIDDLQIELKDKVTGEVKLRFAWNELTGEFSGPDAEAARAFVLAAVQRGHATPPGARVVSILHDVRDRAILAAIFAEAGYHLPPWLAQHVPLRTVRA